MDNNILCFLFEMIQNLSWLYSLIFPLAPDSIWSRRSNLSGVWVNAIVVNNPPAVTIIDKYNYVNQPYQTVISKAEGFAVDLFWTLQSIMNFTGSLNFPAKGNLFQAVVLTGEQGQKSKGGVFLSWVGLNFSCQEGYKYNYSRAWL